MCTPGPRAAILPPPIHRGRLCRENCLLAQRCHHRLEYGNKWRRVWLRTMARPPLSRIQFAERYLQATSKHLCWRERSRSSRRQRTRGARVKCTKKKTLYSHLEEIDLDIRGYLYSLSFATEHRHLSSLFPRRSRALETMKKRWT